VSRILLSAHRSGAAGCSARAVDTISSDVQRTIVVQHVARSTERVAHRRLAQADLLPRCLALCSRIAKPNTMSR